MPPSLQLQVLQSVMPFLRWSQAHFPVRDADVLARFRVRTERLANRIIPLPRGVVRETVRIGGVAGDWLTPPNAPNGPVIMFLHGGGIIFGWSNPNRRILAYISKFSGLSAFGVDYRLAPEHCYPAAHDDCLTVYRGLVQEGRQIVLIGESSGGVLALSTLLRARALALPQPALCVLISPTVDYGFQDPGIWNSRDVFADPAFVVGLHKHYIAGHDTKLPDLSPVSADLAGLGPLWVLAAEHDVLRGEATRLEEAAKRHDLALELITWPHVWHAWHLFVPLLPEATQALRMLGDVIRRHVRLLSGEVRHGWGGEAPARIGGTNRPTTYRMRKVLMSAGRMHSDEVDTDVSLVGRLLALRAPA